MCYCNRQVHVLPPELTVNLIFFYQHTCVVPQMHKNPLQQTCTTLYFIDALRIMKSVTSHCSISFTFKSIKTRLLWKCDWTLPFTYTNLCGRCCYTVEFCWLLCYFLNVQLFYHKLIGDKL